MTLAARLTKLEAMVREQHAQPCPWHHGVVLYPKHFPHGTSSQDARARCRAPGRCRGVQADRLLIIVDRDEEVTTCA